MDKKIKHLELIQNIISRMNSNSFSIKGWTVTLVSALFALAASNSNQGYFLIAYIPVIIFWGLDGYYLSQERQYRDLYKEVSEKEESSINFSLNASEFNKGRNTLASSFFSKTIIWFYFPMIVLMLVIMCFLNQ